MRHCLTSDKVYSQWTQNKLKLFILTKDKEKLCTKWCKKTLSSCLSQHILKTFLESKWKWVKIIMFSSSSSSRLTRLTSGSILSWLMWLKSITELLSPSSPLNDPNTTIQMYKWRRIYMWGWKCEAGYSDITFWMILQVWHLRWVFHFPLFCLLVVSPPPSIFSSVHILIIFKG